MTQSMIERVARAICSDRCSHIGGPDAETLVPGRKNWVAHVRDAATAIKAMREPTDEMKGCSDEIHWGYSCHVCGGLTEGWHAMIDAALAEKP